MESPKWRRYAGSSVHDAATASALSSDSAVASALSQRIARRIGAP